MQGKVIDMFSTNWKVFVIALVAGITVSALVAHFIYRIITKGRVVKQNIFTIKGLEHPVPGTVLTKIPTEGLPNDPAEMTMSFWIYVKSFDRFKGMYRHVLSRGTGTSDPLTSGPYVYIDNHTNKLHVSFLPSKATVFADERLCRGNSCVTINTTSKHQTHINTRMEYIRKTRGITIDYIPTERWVHVVVTANKGTNTIRAYLDGEQVKTASGMTKHTINYSNAPYSIRVATNRAKLLGNAGDDFYIGGKAGSLVGTGFSGMVSNLKFFDRALNKLDVYEEYRRGPVDSTMARLGLPPYGVRTPIYPLQKKDNA
jgi:hypothetical protein